MALTPEEQAVFTKLAAKEGEAAPPPRTLKEILHAIITHVHGDGSQASADLHDAVDNLDDSGNAPAPEAGPEDDAPVKEEPSAEA